MLAFTLQPQSVTALWSILIRAPLRLPGVFPLVHSFWSPAVFAEAAAVGDELGSRLVFSSPRYDHITPLLRQLHWLKAAERIDFKLVVLVYKCLHGAAPSYVVPC